MLLSLEILLRTILLRILNYPILLIGLVGVAIGAIVYLVRLRKKRNTISVISSAPVAPLQQNMPFYDNRSNIINAPPVISNQVNYAPNYNIMPPLRYVIRRCRWINRMRRFWRRMFRRRRGRRWRNQFY